MSVFPTCFIEYMEPAIGQDLVKVYERNGVACSLPEGTRCCGAPWLHQGNVKEFTKAATRNVAALAARGPGRTGTWWWPSPPAPTWSSRTTRSTWPARRRPPMPHWWPSTPPTRPSTWWRLHKAEGTSLDTEFAGRDTGAVPDQVTYHVACHLQAQHIGLKSRDLLKVAGIKATLVQRCSGIDGTWGYRAENYDAGPQGGRARWPGRSPRPATRWSAATATWPTAPSSRRPAPGPLHPMQLMARAYGIPEEQPS